MTRYEKIQAAIDQHIAEVGPIVGKEMLLQRIAAALGEQNDVWFFQGWRVVRHQGNSPIFKGQGVRGQSRHHFGWVATHIETNHSEFFPPSAGMDVPARMVEISLEGENKYRAKMGRFLREKE